METKRNYFLNMLIYSGAAGVLWGGAVVLLTVLFGMYGQQIVQIIMGSNPQSIIRNLIIAVVVITSVMLLVYNYMLAFVHHSLLSGWTGKHSAYSSLGLAVASAVKLFLIQAALIGALYFLFKNMIMLAAQNQMMSMYGMPSNAALPFAALSPYILMVFGTIMGALFLGAICALFLFDSYRYGFFPRGFSVSKAFAGGLLGVAAAVVVISITSAAVFLVLYAGWAALVNIYLLSFLYQAVSAFSFFLSYSLILFFVFRFSIEGHLSVQEDGEPFPTLANFDTTPAVAPKRDGEAFTHSLKHKDDLPHAEPAIPSSDNVPIVTAPPAAPQANKPGLTITSLDLAPNPKEDSPAETSRQNPEHTHTMPVLDTNNIDK